MTPDGGEGDWRPESEEQGREQAPVSVDLYGVKVQSKPAGPEGGEQPETWGEVWQGVQRHLRKICTDLFGLVADGFDTGRSVLQGVGNFFKGIGSLPGAAAKRIEGAHDKADRREARRQELQQAKAGPALPAAAAAHPAAERLLTKLAELQARGLAAELVEVSPGVWVVVLVRPELRENAVALGAQALAGPDIVAQTTTLNIGIDTVSMTIDASPAMLDALQSGCCRPAPSASSPGVLTERFPRNRLTRSPASPGRGRPADLRAKGSPARGSPAKGSPRARTLGFGLLEPHSQRADRPQ